MTAPLRPNRTNLSHNWLAQALWWVFATDRLSRGADYLAILVLVGLAALGALAIAWPWLSVEVPRTLAAGLAVVQATVSFWLERLVSALPRLP